MLTCPICRSQNMDTAKFCGNCGNPFPKPSMPTSSLINCPQGHVYSAVYQFCPYCPQPEPATQGDFATRIEDPITAIESLPQPPAPSAEDFPTQAEPYSTNYETRIGGVEDLETRIRPAEMFETRVGEIDLTEIVDQPTAPPPTPPATPKPSAPTEVISNYAETTLAEMPAVNFEPPRPDQNSTSPASDATVIQNEEPSESISQAHSAAAGSSEPSPQFADSVRQSAAYQLAPETDRRTIVVSEEEAQKQSSKGKIVGWLISYTRHPDGEDHRIFAGYNRIGANPVCDIVIDDETVSGSHAIIVYRDGRFLVKDDLSRNGTFVNGREISEAHPLKSYDQIRVGNTLMTFVAAEPIA